MITLLIQYVISYNHKDVKSSEQYIHKDVKSSEQYILD